VFKVKALNEGERGGQAAKQAPISKFWDSLTEIKLLTPPSLIGFWSKGRGGGGGGRNAFDCIYYCGFEVF
jgi:hypothetical protein